MNQATAAQPEAGQNLPTNLSDPIFPPLMLAICEDACTVWRSAKLTPSQLYGELIETRELQRKDAAAKAELRATRDELAEKLRQTKSTHTVRVTQDLVFPNEFEQLLNSYTGRRSQPKGPTLSHDYICRQFAGQLMRWADSPPDSETWEEFAADIIDGCAKLMLRLTGENTTNDQPTQVAHATAASPGATGGSPASAGPTEPEPGPTFPGKRETDMGNSVISYLSSQRTAVRAEFVYAMCALPGTEFNDFWDILKSLAEQGFVWLDPHIQPTAVNRRTVRVGLVKPANSDGHLARPTHEKPIAAQEGAHATAASLGALLRDGKPRTKGQIIDALGDEPDDLAAVLEELRAAGQVRRIFTPGNPVPEWQIAPERGHPTNDEMTAPDP
jgi:hypothetical protein